MTFISIAQFISTEIINIEFKNTLTSNYISIHVYISISINNLHFFVKRYLITASHCRIHDVYHWLVMMLRSLKLSKAGSHCSLSINRQYTSFALYIIRFDISNKHDKPWRQFCFYKGHYDWTICTKSKFDKTQFNDRTFSL